MIRINLGCTVYTISSIDVTSTYIITVFYVHHYSKIMEGQLMDDEDSYESRKQVAVSLMRKHLPAYAVKCLVAAGFDSFEAI